MCVCVCVCVCVCLIFKHLNLGHDIVELDMAQM
jgi:hypothetical protein